MLEFSDVILGNMAVHKVGNKALEEQVKLSKSEVEIQDDTVKEVLLTYFLAPFKQEVYFQFHHESDLEMNEVYTYCSRIFDDPGSLFEQSVHMARLLYENSSHPKIKGGEFYVVYLPNCWLDQEEVDAIGLFKSETKDTFLKVYPRNNSFGIDRHEGININKLDKGCLIFNQEKEDGFKVCMVDATNKGEEAIYWKDYFLQLKAREDEYFYTQNYMQLCKSFVEDVYNKDNNIPRADQIDFLNTASDFFNNREKFDETEFEKNVIGQAENIQAFQDYKGQYQDDMQVKVIDQFDISENAFKKTKRAMKSVLKLDKNFHVYIHGNRKYVEKGFDDEMDMNYYKLYFNEEH